MSNENPETNKSHHVHSPSTATTAPRHSYQSYQSVANSTYYGPLAHVNTASTTLPAFGGEMQPGLWKGARQRELANPAPLGLFGFALTTFILGCIEMGARDITQPNIVVGSAMAYGGLVQLCAGMWEMAVGNTFGATVLSSYSGLWISLGITFTPGGFNIMATYEKAGGGTPGMFYDAFGIYIFGWVIFTTMILFLTLRSTLAFFSLFLFVDLALILLGIGYFVRDDMDMPNKKLSQAGGFFAILGAFLAWYNGFAGVADDSNSFFVPPVLHFPWSEKGRHSRRQRASMVTNGTNGTNGGT